METFSYVTNVGEILGPVDDVLVPYETFNFNNFDSTKQFGEYAKERLIAFNDPKTEETPSNIVLIVPNLTCITEDKCREECLAIYKKLDSVDFFDAKITRIIGILWNDKPVNSFSDYMALARSLFAYEYKLTRLIELVKLDYNKVYCASAGSAGHVVGSALQIGYEKRTVREIPKSVVLNPDEEHDFPYFGVQILRFTPEELLKAKYYTEVITPFSYSDNEEEESDESP